MAETARWSSKMTEKISSFGKDDIEGPRLWSMMSSDMLHAKLILRCAKRESSTR